jgi:GLPGLI family protein
MKNVSLIFLIIAISHTGFTQTGKVSGKITYIATVRNSLFMQGAGDYSDTTLLYFNDTASSYIVDTKVKADQKKLAAQLAGWDVSIDTKKETISEISNLINKNSIRFDYHRNGSTTISSPYMIGTQDYCSVDTLGDFNWVLLPDTMRILGFVCQKAISKSILAGGAFREFTAWYSPDIPVTYGPKNIFGLPGLILMADSKYYNFTAVKIKIPLQMEETLQLSPCIGRPLIGRRQAEELNNKNREDFMNMQKLRNNL